MIFQPRDDGKLACETRLQKPPVPRLWSQKRSVLQQVTPRTPPHTSPVPAHTVLRKIKIKIKILEYENFVFSYCLD